MEIVKASESSVDQFKTEIPELAWSTGPVSYEYQFGTREFFNLAVESSWPMAGTLFGWDAVHLAVEESELLGILISFLGPEFNERKHAMGKASAALLESGKINEAEVAGLIERAEHAHWLNPALRSHTYYVHALAVKPEHRGRQIGVQLLDYAKKLGRKLDCVDLELDVLSDNPAVAFYRSQGLSLLAETTCPKPAEFGIPPEYRMGILLDNERARS